MLYIEIDKEIDDDEDDEYDFDEECRPITREQYILSFIEEYNIKPITSNMTIVEKKQAKIKVQYLIKDTNITYKELIKGLKLHEKKLLEAQVMRQKFIKDTVYAIHIVDCAKLILTKKNLKIRKEIVKQFFYNAICFFLRKKLITRYQKQEMEKLINIDEIFQQIQNDNSFTATILYNILKILCESVYAFELAESFKKYAEEKLIIVNI
jgi:hypothetical protein